ncbi:kinetochore component rough deal isoform X2 [Andrena cerasifolii]|uniref:kinetochore component rough deal isoform X2 n=1 Tax=Andrena cerasifolii TaxID=2819439 RepID=UPI0040381895
MAWIKVLSGFDREEETINFGARTVVENNGSLYETSTIATIQSDGEVTKDLHVFASVQYTRVCVAIDKSITIFENETCAEILLSVSFGLQITCYCISDDGSFLFVVLSNGVLYCLHLLSKGQLIFSKNITKAKDTVLSMFLQNDCNKHINIYLVTKSGAIYRMSKFNSKLTEDALLNETDVTLKELIEQVECVQLFTGLPNDEVVYVSVGIISKEVSIAMLCSNMLFMWPSEQCTKFSALGYSYTKLKFYKNSTAMLCLRTDYMLNMVCSQTLLGLKVYNEPVADFAVIENNDSSLCQILVLTRNDGDCAKHTLRVLSFPEMEQKFQIHVPIATYLVEIMDPCDEMILFLEGVNDLGSDINYIDTIKIKTVLESLPEYQLQRLLRRIQFDAAEDFAKKFNLSMESIYYAKAARFLSELGPWAKESTGPVKLDALLSIFDKIENVQYVVECCSKALIPEYKQMRKIHSYARARIIENTTKIKDDEQLNLFLINNTLHKLETFHMIWGYQKDSEYYDDDTMREWIRFSRVNFMEEYKTHLSLGEMEAATLIWIRHLPDVMKGITVEIVKDIIAIVPEKVSPCHLWSWLSHFIPTLLSFIPGAMCEIIFWACKKVKSFEQSHYTAWPQIGIDFANKFIQLLRFKETHRHISTQSSYFNFECLSKDSNLKQLVFLIQAMSDIKKLKANYRLPIPLASYIGDPIEVSYMLLDKIHVDKIPEFVNIFLTQYMLNNSLQHDYVLSSYIQKTMKNSRSWWSGEEAPWEKKIAVIISLIQNIETKLQQTLDVLKKASVPWSSTMITLAEANSNLDHILASQIRIEYNCVPTKLVLKRYGYEQIGINNKLAFRIIKENDDNMISHIQQITRNDPLFRRMAFSSCTNHFLSKGNFEKVMEILNSLETDTLLYCCVGIVNYVTAGLTLKVLPKSLEYYIEMFGWVKLKVEEISKKSKTQLHYGNNVIINIDEIKSLYLLRKQFNINITLKQYYTEKEQILQNYIEQLCNVNMGKYDDLSIVYKKSIKVADLLQLQRFHATSLLLESTKNVDVFKYFTRFNEGQLHLMADECQYIHKICFLMLKYVKMDADIAFAVQNLISSALCACSNDDLWHMLLLYVWMNLYQCFNNNTRCSLQSMNKNEEGLPITSWKLYTIYKDLAVTADESLLPLFRNMISVREFYMAKSKPDAEHTVTDTSYQNCNQLSTEETLKELLDKMRKLKVEHNDYCLMQVMKTLYFNSCIISNINPTLLTETKSAYFDFLTTLLNKLISSRTFDFHLGLSCSFMLSESEACKWISVACKVYQPDCIRHLRIVTLGHEYSRLTKREAVMQTYKEKKMLHCWAQTLSKYSISYKEIVTSDASTKREILQRIMNCNGDDMVTLFQDFCSDFGFDIQDCLLLYLQTIIKRWNPKLNICSLNGIKELHIHEDDVNELKTQCNNISVKIKDKVALKNCITTTFPQINFYHYEIFIILMDLIEDKNIEHRNYICFLQNYTRSSEPTQIERDEWVDLNPGYTSLPPIAEWRLPFLPKIKLWTLITPELNLKTCDKWLDIAPILKLQPHIICTLAIKGEITSTWGNRHKTNKWSLCSTNTSLLSNVRKCIDQMTGPNTLHYGTAALYYVVNHTPPGADQVAAVAECYTYAQLSAKDSTPFEAEMLEKIKFKYLRFTTEHILRTHGLGNKNYLSLIGNPHKLVHELYIDESIPLRYRCVIDHRPDINSAICSICALFSINIVKLRMELLQDWLQPDIKYMKLDQTDTFSLVTNHKPNINFDDNLLRACYILQDGDLELSANFLINIGFSDSNEDYSPETRYRALLVLQSIVDTAKLEDLTKRDYQTIRNYMKSLKYIGKLELLGIGYSVNTFEMCSKDELVQILWKTQSYSSQALVAIAQICIDFEIYEYSLWDKSLTQLAKLLMVNELKEILLQVRNISIIVNSNGYLLGWQLIISEPFRKMDMHPTSEQIDDCIESLQLLYSCPIMHMLRFKDIIKYSFQCQQPHLAAALLPFLNDDDKKYVLEKIKDAHNVTKILEDMNNLSLYGILCVSYCNKIMRNTLLNPNVQ